MKVSNPLTIIAIFAGVAEVFATGALIGLDKEIQSTFVYFVMAFPSLIVIAFFSILIIKPHVLYAPSDFEDQSHFLQLNNIKEMVEEETVKVLEKIPSSQKNGIDIKNISREIAESTYNSLNFELEEYVHNFLMKNQDHAFSARSIALTFAVSSRVAKKILHSLSKQGKAVTGTDGDTVLWQAKT